MNPYTALFAGLSLSLLTVSCPLAQAQVINEPVLFAPDSFEASGRFTLTPTFSPDGQTLYLAQTECLPIWECRQTLKRARRTVDGWSALETVDLPVPERVDYPSVTPDGSKLLFSWRVTHPGREAPGSEGNFDLWSLDLTQPDGVPEPLTGPDLNRIRAGAVSTLRFVNNETAPSLTVDGNLYFWSERLDGLGDRDVYLARSDGAGGFEAPELLPAPINSRDADDGVWVSPDGQTLLITYSDRGGCGGSDLFIAFRIGDDPRSWSEPENLGCEINSPYQELAGTLIAGTDTLVFPSTRPDPTLSEGSVALWTVTLPERFRRPG